MREKPCRDLLKHCMLLTFPGPQAANYVEACIHEEPCFVSGFLILLVPTQFSRAQIGGPVVGAALNKLMDHVNTTIVSARNCCE
jgi:hypothetical protein